MTVTTTPAFLVNEQPADDNDATRKKSTSTTLVELATSRYRFGVSTTGETFALPKSGRKVVSMLRGSKTSLRNVLAREYFRAWRKAAPQQALADAMLVLDGMAQESDEVDLYLRVARHDGAHWLDLGDHTGRAIRITQRGWSIEPEAPILFKRTILNGALPEPERGQDLGQLWRLLNVAETDRPLLAAWIMAALHHDIPHPVLSFFGEQGTGKTTAQKMLVSAIDPGPVPTRKPPRDAESWVTAAAGSWLVGLDNLSIMSEWLSDSICRAVTGDGDVRRKLYTDGEHAVFAFRRCVCMNSIDLGAVRGDLGERMLPIKLDPIPDDMRLAEEEIWPAWHEMHPKILGAILDLAVGVLSVLPSVELARKPRMADFARILAAVDRVLGTEGLAHYLEEQNALAADSLGGDAFVTALKGTLGRFEGTAAELLNRVDIDKPPKGWPANPRAVTQRLRRQAPVMRKAGWTVTDDGGRNRRNAVIWTLVAPTREARISGSRDSQTRINDPDREFASLASQGCRPSQDECPRCAGEGCRWCRS
jgi:hypothetical protein